MLALELAESRRRSEISGRSYTCAEHAVIISTYVAPHVARTALLYEAARLGLVPMYPAQLPVGVLAQIDAAEAQLSRSEMGIAWLSPSQAAIVFAHQYRELVRA